MQPKNVQIAAPLDKIKKLDLLRARNAELSRLADPYQRPVDLAMALDRTLTQTPALDILDDCLVQIDLALETMYARRRAYSHYRSTGISGQESIMASIQDFPDAGVQRQIVSMPPQEGKSERITHIGALWLLRRHPDLRIGIVSYEERIAQRMSYLLRNDLETYVGTDGNIDLGIRLKSDNRSVGSWNLAPPHKGSVYAIGIGGALTGRPLDLLIVDDPVKDYRAADSILQSELAWQWWQSVARSRLAPGAPAIVVLTRWHENDIAGRFIQKQKEDEQAERSHYDKWHVINISAQADYDPAKGETDVLGRQPGEFMISARGRTEAQWEATKTATSSRIWSALYQGKPSPDSGDIFQRSWWKRFDSPIWHQEPDGSYVVSDAMELIQSWDMTFKDSSSSDFVVGQVWARKGNNAYLVDQVRARLSFTDSLAAVRRLTTKWPQATTKLIEDTANGPAIINSLRNEINGIIPIQVKGSKLARANAISPIVEAGNVYLPDTSISLYDVEAFIEECTQFPNSAHDDQIDATSQALSRLLLRTNRAKNWLESLAPPCMSCGQPNPQDSSHCSKCGVALEHDSSSDDSDEATNEKYLRSVQDLLASIPSATSFGR